VSRAYRQSPLLVDYFEQYLEDQDINTFFADGDRAELQREPLADAV
jgi:hypothetical protein